MCMVLMLCEFQDGPSCLIDKIDDEDTRPSPFETRLVQLSHIPRMDCFCQSAVICTFKLY